MPISETNDADGVVVRFVPARWDDPATNPVIEEYAALWERLAKE